MANADVEIRLRLNDQASQGIKKTEQDTQRAAEKTATATERASARAAAAATRGANMQRNAWQRMSQAREQLGMRSERTIQREIDRTRAAYQRLAQSGTMAWREQARAADQMRQRVTQLTNEMGKLTAQQKAMGVLKTGAAVAAGIGAAGMVLKAPIEKAISFDTRLAQMTNNAFAERDKVGRIAGMKELEAAINNAVTSGGGTRDSAAQAMDTLVSSGTMGVAEAMKMLPELTKAATASGVDINELTSIALTAMRTFAVKAEEIPNILNQAVAAGQAGGFTLSGLAQFLPRQMAQAAASGMSGRSDFAAIAALNQSALRTAGDQEEAGRNVQTILGLLNDEAVAEHVKKATGVNLTKHLQSEKAKGVSSIDAFAGLLQKSVEKNSSYKDLQAKLANAKNDDERNATLEGMAAIAQRSSLGKLVSNRRAMMALLAMMNNQGYMQDVRSQIMANDVASGGAVDRNLEVISDTAGYQLAKGRELVDIGQKEKLDKVMPTITNAAEAFNKFAGENSGLIGSTTLAATALTALAGAAGIATLAMGGKGILGRVGGGILGRAVGGTVGRAAGGIATAGIASRASAGISSMAGIGKGALKMAGKGGLVGIGSIAGEYALEKAFGSAEESAVTRYGSSALSGAAIGATVGSIIPGIGTAIGAAIGGAGGLIYQGISDWLNSDDKKDVAHQQHEQQVEIDANLRIGLAPGLVLQSQSMEASGGTVRMSTGNINSGAPS